LDLSFCLVWAGVILGGVYLVLGNYVCYEKQVARHKERNDRGV